MPIIQIDSAMTPRILASSTFLQSSKQFSKLTPFSFSVLVFVLLPLCQPQRSMKLRTETDRETLYFDEKHTWK